MYLHQLSTAVAAGCSKSPQPITNHTMGEKSNLIAVCNQMVDQLTRNCNIPIDSTEPIIVTSLVKVDNLEKSSTMGRMAGEIVANRLSQKGFTVKEMKMGQNQIFVKEKQGEFILSRSLKEIAKNYEAEAIVVGTYALGEEVNSKTYGETTFNRPITKLYMSLRIIDTQTSTIGCSSAADMVVTNPAIWQ